MRHNRQRLVSVSTATALFCAGLGATTPAFAVESQAFTVGSSSFTVPSGVTVIKVTATGGGGGAALYTWPSISADRIANGGSGATVVAYRYVTEGDVLTVNVGGGGSAPSVGGSAYGRGGGGGAATAVFLSTISGDSSRIVAGGGGGAASTVAGYNGGDAAAANTAAGGDGGGDHGGSGGNQDGLGTGGDGATGGTPAVGGTGGSGANSGTNATGANLSGQGGAGGGGGGGLGGSGGSDSYSSPDPGGTSASTAGGAAYSGGGGSGSGGGGGGWYGAGGGGFGGGGGSGGKYADVQPSGGGGGGGSTAPSPTNLPAPTFAPANNGGTAAISPSTVATNGGDGSVLIEWNLELDQTITFNQPANADLNQGSQSLIASSTSGLPVMFASSTPTVCTVTGSTVTYLKAGTCSITAAQGGNAEYAAASTVTRSFTITGSAKPGKPPQLRVTQPSSSTYRVAWNKSANATANTRYIVRVNVRGKPPTIILRITKKRHVVLTRKQLLRATVRARGDMTALTYRVRVWAKTGSLTSAPATTFIRLWPQR